jgi:hypothetical protein
MLVAVAGLFTASEHLVVEDRVAEEMGQSVKGRMVLPTLVVAEEARKEMEEDLEVMVVRVLS